ncbi:hypothetical protein [Pectobacterium carotovorum]|uniref:hypothetical protein n=1 Tax=Pectobacterium carotovorum TaxID=554 RepID=UPI0011B297AE|nr:hypothetical protein [Pectobacterium carotovorum]
MAALPGGAGCGVNPQQTSTEKGLSAFGLRLTASCPPGCVWLRGVAVASSSLLPRSPASATRPGVALSCKPAVPSGTVHQSVGGRRLRTLCRPPPQNPPGFPKRVAEAGRVEVVNPQKAKRLMAAAGAAAMMWLMQTGKSQRGGSVSGGKSARRGVGVAGRLTWPKMLPEKAVASMG